MNSKQKINGNTAQEQAATDEVTAAADNGSSKKKKTQVAEDCYVFLAQCPGTSITTACARRLLSELNRLGFTKDSPAARISFVIQSYGGDADAAFRIVRAVRACCTSLDVLIPDSAKSAATLMSLAADKIYMGLDSELGPLDMQLEHPMGERISSALDGTRCLEDLQGAATIMAQTLVTRYGNAFWQQTGIRRREVLQSLLKFASDTIEPIMRQIDPWMLHECIRLLDTTERYAYTLLRDYMFSQRSDGKKLAQTVANRLVTEYPIHSYVITRDEARDNLQLSVEDAETVEGWQDLRAFCQEIWNKQMCLCTASRLPLNFEKIMNGARSYRNAAT